LAIEETRPPVHAHEVLGDHLVAPIPAGTKVEAAFLLVKLDNGEWSARSIGGDAYNRTEFLGQLTAYTHGLTISEAAEWFEDEDPAT
jgi:hypothetical protein